jgi:uncharacterized protein (DUF305 family)
MRHAAVPLAVCLAVSSGAAASPQNPPIVQPGPPGKAPHEITPSESLAAGAPKYTDADVTFMQGMIHHHAQAVEMVELLKTRTNSDAMRKLGDRIEISQKDEIRMMQKWLADRGRAVPEVGPHGAHMTQTMGGMQHDMAMPPMPGMLTDEEMKTLAAAKGTDFDRLFLGGMIKHHGGALTMVKDLFATPGATQDSDIFAFASDVDADQRMEIARMQGMLKELTK